MELNLTPQEKEWLENYLNKKELKECCLESGLGKAMLLSFYDPRSDFWVVNLKDLQQDMLKSVLQNSPEGLDESSINYEIRKSVFGKTTWVLL